MSYEVTATRRRPQHFDDLIGQEFVAETLKNSIKSNKIAHAYLFSGPRGCGKTSTARILAKALNCNNGPTDTPCGQCSNCQEITKGTSLDVIEIDGASNTSVENIRQIKDEVLFPPSNSKYKIYIIDEVHMLSTSAFNALLKTIEEPPPYVIFIFATTELQKVPATIKSRCQQFNFRLVAIDKVKQCLGEAAQELNIQADDEALFWIARESTGSMRDAYTLFDQVVAFSDGHITYEKIRDKLGLIGIERLNSIFESCAENKPDDVLLLLNDFLQGGISIEQLISNCADYLRSLLLLKNNVKKEGLLGNSPERYSAVVLEKWNTVQIERGLSMFFQLYKDIRYSLSPRYEMELTFSRLCWLGQYVSNSDVKKAIDDAKALLQGSASVQNANTHQAAFSHSDYFVNRGIPEINKQVSQPDYTDNFTGTKKDAVPEIDDIKSNSEKKSIEKSFFELDKIFSGMKGDKATDEPENKNTDAGYNAPDKTSGNNEINQPIPQGLPRFSMLDSMDKKEEETEKEPDKNINNNSCNIEEKPSSDGISDSNMNDVPVNEKLIINIPETKTVSEESIATTEAQYYVPEYDSIPNEQWTNVDEPPEEDYYPDDEELEEEATKLEQEYKDSENISFNTPAPNDKKVQDSSFVTVADGSQLSVSKLRENVIANFTVKDSFTASVLERTSIWKLSETSIDTSVSNEYDFELIKRKLSDISQFISGICGKEMSFNVILKEDVPETDTEETKKLPFQVDMLLDVFKGTLIAGKYK